jgi:pimeloyl-ACP methyl ester carboxylesterase
MTLAYDRTGSGPPLVLLHPLGADRGVWRPVLPYLSSARDCIAVDLPGFGASPPLAGDAHPRELARAVAELLAALDLADGSAHVAGNSLGGWVALELALHGAAASVTAIAPAGLWPRPLAPKPSRARQLAAALRPLVPIVTRSRFARRAMLRHTVAHPERVPAADAARLVLAYAAAPGFAAANRAMRAGTFRPELAEPTVPVTLVWPELDRLISRPRGLPSNITELELAGCGHVPMWDDPAAVAYALIVGSSTPTTRRTAATR